MDDPSWTWPAWKFDMNREDLFTKLHDQYNTYPSTIQEPVAFHHDMFEISHKANSIAEFHRLANVRKHERLSELNKALESASFEIIANPCLIGTAQWNCAIQLFRTNSFDSIVRYFGSYLPNDLKRHPVSHTAVLVINDTGFMSGFNEGDNEWARAYAPNSSNRMPLSSCSPPPADTFDKLARDQWVERDERTDAVPFAAILAASEHRPFSRLVSSTPLISDKGMLIYGSEPSITPESDALKEWHENKKVCYQQILPEENLHTKQPPEAYLVSEGKLKSQSSGDLCGEELEQPPAVTAVVATVISSEVSQTITPLHNSRSLTNRVRTCNKRKRP
jgi:hypothetical protein